MADKTKNSNANDEVTDMPAADVSFLIDCLRNTTSGSIQIDIKAVALKRGMQNPRSVSNRITTLNKRYNLPFGAAAGGSKAADANGTKKSAPTGPAAKVDTPKKRAASGAAAKKPAKKVKESSPEEEVKAEDYENDHFEDAQEDEGEFDENEGGETEETEEA